jgi:EF hand
MRPRSFLVFVLSLVLATTTGRLEAAPPVQSRTQAQSRPRQSPQPATNEAPAPAENQEQNPYLERFKQLDANRDGYVSLSEWPLDEAKFRIVDRNEDGRLSRIELLTPNVVRHDPRFQPMRGLYTIQYGPMPQGRGGVVDYTPLERRTGFENQWSPTANHQDQLLFQNLDRNRDDRLSRNEWTATQDLFDRLDRNRDGLLSPGEWP